MKSLFKFLSIVGLILLLTNNSYAQNTGTPSQIRVKVDANNYLILIAAAQTSPVSNPTVFNNIRLKTDSSNQLYVVVTGNITPTTITCSSSVGTVNTVLVGGTPCSWTGSPTLTSLTLGAGPTAQLSVAYDGTSVNGIYVRSTTDDGAGETHLARFQTTTASNNGFEFSVFNAGNTGKYSRLGTLGSIPLVFPYSVSGTQRFVIADNGVNNISNRPLTIVSTDTSLNSGLAIVNRNGPQSYALGVANTTYGFYIRDETNSAIRWIVDTSGNFISGNDNTTDIGASGATRPRTVYVGTSYVGPLFNATSTYQVNGVLSESATAPTIASGGCTSPAVTSNNGTTAFLITIGSSCTGIKTFTLTLPAAAHFWACDGNNNTSDAQQQSNYIVPRATSTTAVIVTSYDRVTGLQEDFTAADTYLMKCKAE